MGDGRCVDAVLVVLERVGDYLVHCLVQRVVVVIAHGLELVMMVEIPQFVDICGEMVVGAGAHRRLGYH